MGEARKIALAKIKSVLVSEDETQNLNMEAENLLAEMNFPNRYWFHKFTHENSLTFVKQEGDVALVNLEQYQQRITELKQIVQQYPLEKSLI